MKNDLETSVSEKVRTIKLRMISKYVTLKIGEWTRWAEILDAK